MELSSRVNNTDRLTRAIERLALRYTHNNRPMAGALVLAIHTAVIAAILWSLMWSKSRTHILVGLALWLAIMAQHWYFGGCWGVRSERRIWKTKEWYGPWTSLFILLQKAFGTHDTKWAHETIFTSFAAIVLGIGVYRLASSQESLPRVINRK